MKDNFFVSLSGCILDLQYRDLGALQAIILVYIMYWNTWADLVKLSFFMGKKNENNTFQAHNTKCVYIIMIFTLYSDL